jgi:hypothetical protein
MTEDEIKCLNNAKRTLQEIYDICQQHMGLGKPKSEIFQDINNKATYARSQISKVLK